MPTNGSLNYMSLSELAKLNEGEARTYLEEIRWPNGPTCVHCESRRVTKINGKSSNVRRGLLQCNDCRGQFSVTVGSIFEDSHIPLNKWLFAFGLICSSKKGVSALQLQRNLGLGSYRTAWFMAHRIRYAMRSKPMRPFLRGTVEVDETYIGGKSRQGRRGRGSERKTPVVALVERNGGRIAVKPVERVSAKELKSAIREAVRKNAKIMTDDWRSYRGIGKEFAGGHHVVKHSEGQYVLGDAHTNTAESFFALLKRGVHGTFHHVSRNHLHRYCDEFGFSWDHRKVNDGARTVAALRLAEGKRLMYKQPIY